jgi:hypothetical protein
MATHAEILQMLEDHHNLISCDQAFLDHVLVAHFGPTGEPEP